MKFNLLWVGGVALALTLGACAQEFDDDGELGTFEAAIAEAVEDGGEALEAEFNQCLDTGRNHGACVSCCEHMCNQLATHDAQGCNRHCSQQYCAGGVVIDKPKKPIKVKPGNYETETETEVQALEVRR
ncbi:MAG: hypothetical protein ACI9MR_001640 [Myxococcota bacterium]